MAYQMMEAHSSALEFIIPEIKNLLENQGLNQQGSQLDQNFYLDDKEDPPKKIAGKIKKQKKSNAEVKALFSATKVKTRNFLSNISYRRIKEQDFDKYSFVVHVYSFLIKDFNLFFFFWDSKFNNECDHEMVLMLWQHCMPQTLHEYIKKPDNFEKLCSGNE